MDDRQIEIVLTPGQSVFTFADTTEIHKGQFWPALHKAHYVGPTKDRRCIIRDLTTQREYVIEREAIASTAAEAMMTYTIACIDRVVRSEIDAGIAARRIIFANEIGLRWMRENGELKDDPPRGGPENEE